MLCRHYRNENEGKSDRVIYIRYDFDKVAEDKNWYTSYSYGY